MYWIRWTKGRLRFYVCQDLYRQDIENELSALDEDISPRISHLNGQPRAKGGFSSPVEMEAEHREESRERLLKHLKEANEQVEKIGGALKTLSVMERRALELAYMKTSYETDKQIADCFKLSQRAFWRLKISALHKVYVNLKGAHVIDLEECVKREEQRHKLSKKLKEQDRAEDLEKRKKPLGEIVNIGKDVKSDWMLASPEAWEKRAALLKRLEKRIAREMQYATKHKEC